MKKQTNRKKTLAAAFITLIVLTISLSACSQETVNASVRQNQGTKSGLSNGRGTGNKNTGNSSVTVSDELQASDSADSSSYGAAGALQEEDLTLREMLTYAIQDESLAHAEYEQIIAAYGNNNPYTNIIQAEETHISSLTTLFETYDIPVPEDLSSSYTIPAATLLQAAQTGVTAEINNIEMYELFLTYDLPADVEKVFTSLMDASKNHLTAFEKQADRLD
ncbi:MAG TPA: hypothetical protein PLU43_00045 [Lachnospiraceae bacterium]|nr:hypothetical protein [Lachnospiraceae bacterium]